MKHTILCILFYFVFNTSFSATTDKSILRKCGSTENLIRLKSTDPSLETRMREIEVFTTKYQLQKETANSVNSAIVIPVVFHIVYNSPSQNISDAQCQAQISQLNLDFSRANTDAGNVPSIWQGVAASTGIQFCLAQRDPTGSATTGIERRSTTITSFATNDAVKQYALGGMNAWPSTAYLNIWVCNLGSGLLGYAQFPGGPTATDGVVIQYNSIGSMLQPGSFANYNLGRTATHEVGHWLNLIHIWGDESGCGGTDNVSDTPNQGSENYGCPAFPLIDGCATSSPGVMFMNYMDYVNDACMYMFTSGQSTRMNALFAQGGPRVSLLTSTGCQSPVQSTCGVPAFPAASSITSSGVTLSWTAVSGASSYTVKYKKSIASTWTTSTTSTTSKSLTGLSANSIYQWQVQAICALGGGALTAVSSFTTSIAPPCGIPSSLSTSNITPGSAVLNWTSVSGAIVYSVQYKVTGATAWINASSATNAKILSGLVPSTSYTFQVSATCQSGTSIYSGTNTFITLPSNCSDTYEPNDTYQSPTAVPTNSDLTGQISTSTDNDWFTFSTTAPNTKIMIVLSNLPRDYNFTLYNSSLMSLGTSASVGTANDTIKKNFTAAGNYYLRVFGKSTAYDAVMCYTLRINVGSTNFRLDEDVQDSNTPVQANLTLFPNPVKDVLNVVFNSSNSESATIRVFDMVGKTVSNIPLEAVETENKFAIDLTAFHKGIYFVEVIQSGTRITRKIILE
jgi:hypothetical protein